MAGVGEFMPTELRRGGGMADSDHSRDRAPSGGPGISSGLSKVPKQRALLALNLVAGIPKG